MKIIQPKVELLLTEDPIELLRKIERCGRICYRSEGNITSDSYKGFLRGLIKRGHLSDIEHGSVTAMITCDRGVSHEIVRHRIGSYSQESTRYVNYKEGIEVIKPCFWDTEKPKEYNDFIRYQEWAKIMEYIEKSYKYLIEIGAKPEEARAILPNSLKTEIAVTYNFREWRHFIELRGSKGAHPQIRQITIMILKELQNMIPIVFDDFKVDGDIIGLA